MMKRYQLLIRFISSNSKKPMNLEPPPPRTPGIRFLPCGFELQTTFELIICHFFGTHQIQTLLFGVEYQVWRYSSNKPRMKWKEVKEQRHLYLIGYQSDEREPNRRPRQGPTMTARKQWHNLSPLWNCDSHQWVVSQVDSYVEYSQKSPPWSLPEIHFLITFQDKKN